MESKSPIQILLDGVEWESLPAEPPELDGEVPFATHRGVLDLGGVKLKVYQLSDGQRVIDAEDLEALFGGGES
ncbi:MAG: hypothetical protein M0R80_01355 [Proteobacteria bacterium]|jgi:hypothetical protein|nr:hypothetical protein [Pseudomonadota bacterium]